MPPPVLGRLCVLTQVWETQAGLNTREFGKCPLTGNRLSLNMKTQSEANAMEKHDSNSRTTGGLECPRCNVTGFKTSLSKGVVLVLGRNKYEGHLR